MALAEGTKGSKILPVELELDDDSIAANKTVVIVINLNYVWDAVNTKWVRMTQPS